MMKGRSYVCEMTSKTGVTDDTADSWALIEAGASNPLYIKRTVIKVRDNVTFYMADYQWNKVTTKGAPVEEAASSSRVIQVDPGGAAESFTFLGELSTEPTLYSTADDEQRGRKAWVSVHPGWNYGGLDYDLHGDEWIFVEQSALWGIKGYNASHGAALLTATIEVVELL